MNLSRSILYSKIENTLYLCIDIFTLDSLKLDLVRLGSQYGGWWVPKDLTNPDVRKVICISAGIGTDFSFDRALVSLGHSVVAIDPIKSYCDEYFQEIGSTGRVHVVNKALSSLEGSIIISPPKDPNHASWAIKQSQKKEKTDLLVQTESLSNLIQKSKEKFKDQEIRVIKMDIEGAEGQVIAEIVELEICVEWLCIEFDFFALISLKKPLRKVKAFFKVFLLINGIKKIGYRYVLREDSNLYFYHAAGS
jgi:FkbM family methyltransferase